MLFTFKNYFVSVIYINNSISFLAENNNVKLTCNINYFELFDIEHLYEIISPNSIDIINNSIEDILVINITLTICNIPKVIKYQFTLEKEKKPEVEFNIIKAFPITPIIHRFCFPGFIIGNKHFMLDSGTYKVNNNLIDVNTGFDYTKVVEEFPVCAIKVKDFRYNYTKLDKFMLGNNTHSSYENFSVKFTNTLHKYAYIHVSISILYYSDDYYSKDLDTLHMDNIFILNNNYYLGFGKTKLWMPNTTFFKIEINNAVFEYLPIIIPKIIININNAI